MPSNRRIIRRLSNRHYHIRHLRKHAYAARRESKRHRWRRFVLIAIRNVQARRVQKKTLTACSAVVEQDIRVEPLHEDGFVVLGFRERRSRVAIAKSPADGWRRVYERFAAIVNGGVGSKKGITDETGLLFRYDDGIGEI